jgi:hypothetical protein
MIFWNTYPRVLGTPFRIICNNKEEFINNFNMINGICDKLYVGLYSCEKDGSMNNVTLNVFSYDIDWDDKYNSMVELHNHFNKLGWYHSCVFSTSGFWIHVYPIPRTYDKETAKRKLAAMQEFGLEGTSLKFGAPKKEAIDNSVKGDVSRLCRMMFSYDKTRNRYAIFLNQDDIDKGYNHILDISTNCDKKRRFQIFTFGDKYALDPEEIKVIVKNNNELYDNIIEGKYELSVPEDIDKFNKNMLEQLPNCLKAWVVDPEYSTWRARIFITLYLREKGFTREQIKTFLKPFYEKVKRSDKWGNNWVHYERVAQADQHVFRRNDLKFPSCRTIYEEGLCKGCSKLKEKNFSLPYRSH